MVKSGEPREGSRKPKVIARRQNQVKSRWRTVDRKAEDSSLMLDACNSDGRGLTASRKQAKAAANTGCAETESAQTRPACKTRDAKHGAE